MKEKIKEQVEALARVGRNAYDHEMSRFGNWELAECVARNEVWQAVKEMQDRQEPDFLTPEWITWIHSGEYRKQQQMRKCKDAILYRLACNGAGIGLVHKYSRPAYKNRSFRKHAGAM